jgi:hypothetical protein
MKDVSVVNLAERLSERALHQGFRNLATRV